MRLGERQQERRLLGGARQPPAGGFPSLTALRPGKRPPGPFLFFFYGTGCRGGGVSFRPPFSVLEPPAVRGPPPRRPAPPPRPPARPGDVGGGTAAGTAAPG